MITCDKQKQVHKYDNTIIIILLILIRLKYKLICYHYHIEKQGEKVDNQSAAKIKEKQDN